jgi:hypothetical protein
MAPPGWLLPPGHRGAAAHAERLRSTIRVKPVDFADANAEGEARTVSRSAAGATLRVEALSRYSPGVRRYFKLADKFRLAYDY